MGSGYEQAETVFEQHRADIAGALLGAGAQEADIGHIEACLRRGEAFDAGLDLGDETCGRGRIVTAQVQFECEANLPALAGLGTPVAARARDQSQPRGRGTARSLFGD